MTTKLTALTLAITLWVPLAASATEVPARGMSQQQVRERFGAPRQVQPPVGQPPITRWHYPDFTVYFENQRALHSVMEHAAPQDSATNVSAADASPANADAGELLVDQRPPQRPRTDSAQPATPPPTDADRHEAPQPPPAPATDEQSRESMDSPAGRTPRAELQNPEREQAGRFRFDPASGRIVTTDESAPQPARPDGEATPPLATPDGAGQVPVANPNEAR